MSIYDYIYDLAHEFGRLFWSYDDYDFVVNGAGLLMLALCVRLFWRLARSEKL